MCSDSADDDDDDSSGRSAHVFEMDMSELTRSYNLPSHILHLRPYSDDCDVSRHLQATPRPRAAAVSVHSISTVLRGSQFGPFNCHVVKREPQTPPIDSFAATDECCLEA